MNDDRIDLLHEMLLTPLQMPMHELGSEAAKRMSPSVEPSFDRGVWHGYKLALAVFERWLNMISSPHEPQRFAVHENPSGILPDGEMRIGEWQQSNGMWRGEKEDGGSCNGRTWDEVQK